MSSPTRWRLGLAAVVFSLWTMAASQQVPSFPGRVQRVGGTGLSHVTVRIEGAGSTETSDTGEFIFPLSGSLKVGYPAVFHVTDWVILKPCELKNGRTYLHDPGAEPLELLVLPPHDPRLLSATASGSFIDCIIEEQSSRIAPKSRSGAGPRSALPGEQSSPFSIQADAKENRAGTDPETLAPPLSHLVEVAYRFPVAQIHSAPSLPKSNEVEDPAREEFLAEKAKELGFSVKELKSAIESWTKSVEDPYQKGLAALHDGRYAEASQYITESLSAPGADVLRYVSLASAEYSQGHYPTAASALKKVLAVHPDDPDVLNSLGRVLDVQGRYGEAEPLLKHALAINEQALGPDNPQVAIILNSLAALYRHQGRSNEAVPLLERALTIEEKTLGPDNPSIATSLTGLTALCEDLGMYSEAEVLAKRALAIDERALGQDNWYVAAILNHLGAIYRHQRRYSEAVPLLERGLAIEEKTLGPDNPNIATSVTGLAALYEDQGRYNEGLPLLERALAINEKALGPNHPAVAQIEENLAATLRKLGRDVEAKGYEEQAAKIREKK
jgi:tetratricopeptide (TPR) repeat protein